MDVMYVAGQILLGIAFLCSILGTLGLFNMLLYVWVDEGGPRQGLLSHVGVWLASVGLLAGLIHTSMLNNWLGLGVLAAGAQ